ncbi:MAG: glycosyltransferase family 39 protein [Actinomycetota bacterium]|nr:glycosyltransferase family 39 protein [Actinomycetota bacterium]
MLVGQAAAAGGGRHRVAAERDRGRDSGRLAARLTLAAVLAVQALISVWLTGRNTAYQDEALYLWAGRLEWARWLHGSRIPIAFPGYFSGSSVVYPPIAAVADSLGGLTGARLLSTCFMLAATWLLWSATRRLLDERAALFAAAVFAFTGSALFLGAFATYDAMALLLLAAAAWTALRTAGQSRRRQVALLTLMVLLLLVANAAKYASALWDPVVLALAALADVRTRGWGSGVRTGLGITAGLGLLIVAAIFAGGHSYLAGIEFSTVSRSLGTQPPATVLAASAAWIGLVAVAAIVGAVIVTRRGAGSGMALTGWVLAVAVLLAPAEQARIHTTVSLFKHVGYGGWFGAAMAGAALSALVGVLTGRPVAERHRPDGNRGRRAAAVGVATALVTAAGLLGLHQASGNYQTWPGTGALVARLRPLAAGQPGRDLAEEPAVVSYYLRAAPSTWSSTLYFRYRDRATGATLTGMRAYAAAIRHHYFSLIVIGYVSVRYRDQAIAAVVSRTPGYRLVGTVPWSAGRRHGRFWIWRWAGRRG